MRRVAGDVLERLATMPDAEVYELARIVAREAQIRRQRDPVYQANRATGVAVAQARDAR